MWCAEQSASTRLVAHRCGLVHDGIRRGCSRNVGRTLRDTARVLEGPAWYELLDRSAPQCCRSTPQKRKVKGVCFYQAGLDGTCPAHPVDAKSTRHASEPNCSVSPLCSA